VDGDEGVMKKTGLFLCTGCSIHKAIGVDTFETVAGETKVAFHVTHNRLCSPDGIRSIHQAIVRMGLDALVIAACSPRMKTQEFVFDPAKIAVERVNLREHVVWSHNTEDENTEMMAADLVRMGLAKVMAVKPTSPRKETIAQTVLVVGAGLAGLSAAKAAAAMGYPVVLVEASHKLGGYIADIKEGIPDKPPYDRTQENRIDALISEVTNDSRIQVLLSSRIKAIKGQPGQFQVDVENAPSFTAGAIVQATGAKPYDATKLDGLGYGNLKDVVTSCELDRLLKENRLERPSDKKMPERILFVQCAGSRDPRHLAYCSSECCATTLRQASLIRRDFPGVECMVIYRDLRAPGQLEYFYQSVQEEGVLFTRGLVDNIRADSDKLLVQIKESLLGDNAILEADLVVLAVGMVPNSADGEAIRQLVDAKARVEKNESDTQVAQAKKIVESLSRHEGTEILNLSYRQGPDLPTLSYDFPDSHFICFPYETRRTGIYTAGAVRAPMNAAEAEEDGWGAAMKAAQLIASSERGEAVHPRAGDASIADFFLQRCTQCKRCTEECPFGSLDEDIKGTPQYNALRCRRCGICLGACPERIISFPDYSVAAVSEMIKAIDVPDEFEEKPRIVAFLCENDAYPALDDAAARGAVWNPWVRIIPVRCLGAINIIWVADALSRGIDGVILIGCKSGHDFVSDKASNKSAANSPVKPSAPEGPARMVLAVPDEPARGRKPVLRDEVAAVVAKQQYPRERLYDFQCHYIKGSELAKTRFQNIQETLQRLVLEPGRVKILELSRDDFQRIPQELDVFARELEAMGANPLKGF
jgi:quinone-modifying oxidoreductase, subunit QmoB